MLMWNIREKRINSSSIRVPLFVIVCFFLFTHIASGGRHNDETDVAFYPHTLAILHSFPTLPHRTYCKLLMAIFLIGRVYSYSQQITHFPYIPSTTLVRFIGRRNFPASAFRRFIFLHPGLKTQIQAFGSKHKFTRKHKTTLKCWISFVVNQRAQNLRDRRRRTSRDETVVKSRPRAAFLIRCYQLMSSFISAGLSGMHYDR